MLPRKLRLTPDQQDLIRLLGTLLEGSHTVFGLKDRQHRYLYINNEATRVFGFPLEDIIGCQPDEFFLPASAKVMHKHQETVMTSGRAERFVDRIGVGNRVFTYASVYFPLKDMLGMVTSVGFIGVHIQDRGWLNADMQHMLEAAQGTILDLQKRVDNMHLQITTDPITGVWNRVQSEVIARQEMSRQKRTSTEVSVVFVDLDHFKNINDTLGYAIGDAVLIEFCRVAQSCLRAADVLARWDGETFVIILPDTGLESAEWAAERIRLEVQAHHFEHVDSLTASFGIATYIQGETWHHWCERADAALYRAKCNGRNRIASDKAMPGVGIPAEVAHSSGFLRLAWRRHYESGHPVVDRQHRQLFVYANNLLSALLAGKPRESINLLIDQMITAISEHFRDEEAILREAGFPESDEHTRIHGRILRKARQLSKHYHDEKLELGELFRFLAYDVVAMHMLVDDRKFFPCLNNGTAEPAPASAPEKTASSPAKTVKTGSGKATAPPGKTKAPKPAKSRKTPPAAKKTPRRRAKNPPSS